MPRYYVTAETSPKWAVVVAPTPQVAMAYVRDHPNVLQSSDPEALYNLYAKELGDKD